MNHRLIFLLLIIFTSCSDSTEYKIKFDDIGRLNEDDKILIKGVHVGQVKDIVVDEDEKMLVTISITKDIQVTEGSKFILQSELLGSQYIEVELADINNELVKLEQLQQGEIRPMDTTGLRKITLEEYDSLMQSNPGAIIFDSILKGLSPAYKNRKKRVE